MIGAIEQRYGDFGPTLAAEYLAKDAGLGISRETVRKLMMRAGIWRASPRKLDRYTCGVRAAVAGANWCNGTPAFMRGWSSAARTRCIWWR